MKILVLCALFILSTFCIVNVTGTYLEKYKNCEKIDRNPDFPKHLIVNKLWKLHRLWSKDEKQDPNSRLVTRTINCTLTDVIFTETTTEVKDSIRNNMEHRLKDQPDWNADFILMTLQEGYKGILLADQGIPGAFTGVPNITYDAPGIDKFETTIVRLKLIDDKNLVVMDCRTSPKTAIYTLPGATPSPFIIFNLIKEFDLDKGHSVCEPMKNFVWHVKN